MTWHERVLWSILRDRQFGNYKFRRQVVLGNYIVDFVCFDTRLVVELDGRGHVDEQAYDASRTRWLESQGFHVIRFWNDELSEDMTRVTQMIRERLREPLTPRPPLPQRGEGEK